MNTKKNTPRDELKALRARVRFQAIELRKAGRDVMRLLKWKSKRCQLTKREQMTAMSWSVVFAKAFIKR